MNLKKTICIALSAAAIFCTALTSCGGKSENNADSASAAVSDSEEKNADVIQIADSLKDKITYKDQLNELSADMIQKIYSLSADSDYTKAKVYVGSGGTTAEEIACFETDSQEKSDKVKAALESRIESQKSAFENYQPKEMDKLNDPVLIQKGNNVFMCISDDNQTAKDIIG
ncbi:MAG: DUF4358 domain-containing protein [Oscillospiraceae bacterium]